MGTPVQNESVQFDVTDGISQQEEAQFQAALDGAKAENGGQDTPLTQALADYMKALKSGDPEAIKAAEDKLKGMGITDPDEFLNDFAKNELGTQGNGKGTEGTGGGGKGGAGKGKGAGKGQGAEKPGQGEGGAKDLKGKVQEYVNLKAKVENGTATEEDKAKLEQLTQDLKDSGIDPDAFAAANNITPEETQQGQ
jgi:hypothetical protein